MLSASGGSGRGTEADRAPVVSYTHRMLDQPLPVSRLGLSGPGVYPLAPAVIEPRPGGRRVPARRRAEAHLAGERRPADRGGQPGRGGAAVLVVRVRVGARRSCRRSSCRPATNWPCRRSCWAWSPTRTRRKTTSASSFGVVPVQPSRTRAGSVSSTPASSVRVDVPEVGGELQVAVVEVGEVGLLAVQAAAHRRAEQEHVRRRAVVGPVGGVGAHPPAELGVDRDDHALPPARSSPSGPRTRLTAASSSLEQALLRRRGRRRAGRSRRARRRTPGSPRRPRRSGDQLELGGERGAPAGRGARPARRRASASSASSGGP